MNVVILTGNLARDPETTYPRENMVVTKFTIAVNRMSRKEGADTADFIRVTAFDKQAELVGKYLRKGSKVGIEGRIQTGSYEKDGKTVYTTDVLANRVEFLDRKSDSGGSGGFGGSSDGGGGFGGSSGQFSGSPAPGPGAPPKPAEAPALPPDGFDELDEDMPF